MLELVAEGERRQEELGGLLAQLTEPPCTLFLEGDLAAGKTTLARGFLRGLGYGGKVKSPTYTLLEPYELRDRVCYHFDLYRLSDAEELVYLGIEELMRDDAIWLVEWPERGAGLLPAADLIVHIEHQGDRRRLLFTPGSEKGGRIISGLQKLWNEH